MMITDTRTSTRTSTRTVVAQVGNIREAEQGSRDLTLLPALYGDEKARAATDEQIQHMQVFFKPEHIGDVFIYKRIGFIIQSVGENTLRCITVVDDADVLLWLAKFVETVHAAGGGVQLAPYTMLVSMEDFARQHNLTINKNGKPQVFNGPSTRSTNPVGMEVA